MSNYFLRKLMRFADLTGDDRRRIETLTWKSDYVAAGTDILLEGSQPRFINVTLVGWAFRYKQLADGRRQILSVLLPGDMCDPCVFMLGKMSHAIATLTPAIVMRLPEKVVMTLMEESPMLTKAFWLDLHVAAEVQREWTASLGRRTAIERTAHLLCELMVRLRSVGLADADGCDLPMTQVDLGDALGLSAVHVNRTLQDMRAMKLIDLRHKRLTVHDEGALQALGLFDPAYLHLQRSPGDLNFVPHSTN